MQVIENITNRENLVRGVDFLQEHGVDNRYGDMFPRMVLDQNVLALYPNKNRRSYVSLGGDEELIDVALRGVLMVGSYVGELDYVAQPYSDIFPRLARGQRFTVLVEDPSKRQVVKLLSPEKIEQVKARYEELEDRNVLGAIIIKE